MKLGLLGPAEGDLGGLGEAAERLVHLKVDRVIYLGPDDALERTIGAWAKRLVGDDPGESAVWRRASELAIAGSPAEIDAFVKKDRARLALHVFESLPGGGTARTIEIVGDRVAVLVHEKALLDEEDIFAANLILYGKSDRPVVRRIGARWFISPGILGAPGGGACVLDDGGDDVVVTIYDGSGKACHSEALTLQRSTKMRVQGAP
jgi:hypothetical protein